MAAVRHTAAAVLERWLALDLIVTDGRCVGVTALDPAGRRAICPRRPGRRSRPAAHGQMFAVTTNPNEATGDGIAMALRAGVPVADVEFVQFHPTALHHPAMPRPLLSEALRGHGALLSDDRGERFVDELAPVTSSAGRWPSGWRQSGVDHLWLDATALENFDRRFPTLADRYAVAGLDPAVDWLPIAPAAHYISGGVLTDLDGASALAGPLGGRARRRARGCTAPTASLPTRCSKGWSSARGSQRRSPSGRTGPEPTGVMAAVLSAASAVRGAAAPGWRQDRRPAAAADGQWSPMAGGMGDAVKLRALLQRVDDRGCGGQPDPQRRLTSAGAGSCRGAPRLAGATRSTGRPRSCQPVHAFGRAARVARSCARRPGERTRGLSSRSPREVWRRRLVHGREPVMHRGRRAP